MIAHATAVYTKEILITELPLGLLLPSLLQDIWKGISSLSLITLELILDYVFRICMACAKEQVVSQLLKSFKNRIYLYEWKFFLSSLCGAFRQDHLNL